MMRVTSRRKWSAFLGGLTAVAAAALVAFGLWAQWQVHRKEERADHLVDQLLVADLTRVADVANQLDTMPGPWRSRLERIAGDNDYDDAERLRAQLALARTNPDIPPQLARRLLRAEPTEVAVILRAVASQADQCRNLFWEVAADASQLADQRFRATVALASLEPDSTRWNEVAGPTAAALVRMNPLLIPEWVRMLRPVRARLKKALATEFMANSAHEGRRTLAAGILADFAVDDPDLLSDVLLSAGESQFPMLFPIVKAHSVKATAIFESVLAEPVPTGKDVRLQTRRRANAATVLFLLDKPEAVQTGLGQATDPDLRTALIELLPALVEFDSLWPLSRPPHGDLTRQAVILAADAFRSGGRLDPTAQSRLEGDLVERFLRDESPAVHSAAEWLLRRIGTQSRLEELTTGLAGKTQTGKWWVTPSGHTLALVRGPVELGGEPRENAVSNSRTIQHNYAVSTHEVTVAQYRRFFPNHRFDANVTPNQDCPVSNVSWFDAARYCRRLSEAEGVPEKEMAYPETDGNRPEGYYSDINRPLLLPADWQQRTGYRLPTEAEWEFACRAGTTNPRFFGRAGDALIHYAWYKDNSTARSWPVGSLRPSLIGLFDVFGNVGEWCADGRDPPSSVVDRLTVTFRQHRAFRGGTFKSSADEFGADQRIFASPHWGFSYNGFRVVRTIRPDVP